jgi:hypothetical protein
MTIDTLTQRQAIRPRLRPIGRRALVLAVAVTATLTVLGPSGYLAQLQVALAAAVTQFEAPQADKSAADPMPGMPGMADMPGMTMPGHRMPARPTTP